MTGDGSRLTAPAAILRQHDPDRFRFALFAPRECREALFTLYAFNHEVAKTRESVSESMIGAIRLQWWRESIEGIYAGEPRQHEVVLPLADAVAAYDLPRAPFDALIDARERDLEDRPMKDLEEAERCLRATTEPLVRLSAAILDPSNSAVLEPLADIAAGHAFIGKLRATAHLEAQRRPFFPRTLLEKHGGSPRAFSELKADEGARAAVRELADRASALTRRGLLKLRKTKRITPLLLPARQTRSRTDMLKRVGHDPFTQSFAAPDPFDVWRFWIASLTRRY
ncbi:MAG: squalene/phytoene synthase family protein [Nisaea sp.]|uniref:phytoene/squalene synthase family protein n=1 Tax=Nisaea sp. TaxID=2024842 RepID=UPI001B213AB7|nr:squalene/phytoene synthase family protein [Nisaea sp.]MBO6558961.1 squalene/phytoene synthase family protein [Nisaea sp.]